MSNEASAAAIINNHVSNIPEAIILHCTKFEEGSAVTPRYTRLK